MITKNADALLHAGNLVFRFARTYRTAFHEDGETPESDTDHTVMLCVCASALAEQLYAEKLNIGLVAQFAIVHDLVEVYAGDTDTFGLDKDDKNKKQEIETKALVQLGAEFGEQLPWIPNTIHAYEAMDTPEARFVRTVDKLMVKIGHVLNHGSYFKKRGLDRDTMWHMYQTKTRPEELRYADEFPEVVALIDELIMEARKRAFGE